MAGGISELSFEAKHCISSRNRRYRSYINIQSRKSAYAHRKADFFVLCLILQVAILICHLS